MATCQASSFRKVSHCIFDMDGTLIDSESIYEVILRQILEKFGKSYTEELRVKILGSPEPVTASILITELKLPITVAEFLKEMDRLVHELMGDVKLKPGAERLVKHLHANNIPIALATSSFETIFELKTQHHRELFNLFCHKVFGTTDPEVKEGKPAPDIFLIAAKRFHGQPPPCCCLVFEDSPNGIKAALSAGMQCVMIPEEHTPVKMHMGTQIIKSLEEFKPQDFGLPAFSSN